jgi:hypothetical protein
MPSNDLQSIVPVDVKLHPLVILTEIAFIIGHSRVP